MLTSADYVHVECIQQMSVVVVNSGFVMPVSYVLEMCRDTDTMTTVFRKLKKLYFMIFPSTCGFIFFVLLMLTSSQYSYTSSTFLDI